jgi:hypothetical protein
VSKRRSRLPVQRDGSLPNPAKPGVADEDPGLAGNQNKIKPGKTNYQNRIFDVCDLLVSFGSFVVKQISQ